MDSSGLLVEVGMAQTMASQSGLEIFDTDVGFVLPEAEDDEHDSGEGLM